MTFQWTAGIEGSENCAVAIQVSSIPLHYFPHYCTFFYKGLTLRSLDYALTTREQFTFNHQVLSSFWHSFYLLRRDESMCQHKAT